MSVKIISNVWDESRAEGGALLVMLALADHANDDGVSWPGMDRLAERARMDVRRTQRVVNELIESGELYVLRQHGRGHTNLYLVTIGHTERTLIKILTQKFDKTADEARRLAYDILQRRSGEKVSPEPPFTVEKVVSGAEKVAPAPEKVVSDAEKVANPAIKGGPGTTRTVINRQLTVTEPSEEPARETDGETFALDNFMRLQLSGPQLDQLRHATCVRTGCDAFEIRCVSQTQADFARLRINGKISDALAYKYAGPVSVTYTLGPDP